MDMAARVVTVGNASAPQWWMMALNRAATAGEESRHDCNVGVAAVRAKLAGFVHVEVPETRS